MVSWIKVLNFEAYSKGGTRKRGQVKSDDLYSKICPRFNSLLILIFYGVLFFSCRFFSLHFSSVWALRVITTLRASQFSLLFQAPHVMFKLSKLSHIIWLFLHFSTVISSQAVFCCPFSDITSLQTAAANSIFLTPLLWSSHPLLKTNFLSLLFTIAAAAFLIWSVMQDSVLQFHFKGIKIDWLIL